MKNRVVFSLVFLFLIKPSFAFSGSIQHQITAAIDPTTHTLQVEDTITLPEDALKTGRALTFMLHGGLKPTSSTPGVMIEQEDAGAPASHPDLPLKKFRVTLEKGRNIFQVRYAGKIHHPLKEEGENYGRRFRETPGTISTEGIFLAGTSYWYPVFHESLVRFSLEIALPETWDAVSQGARTHHAHEAEKTTVRWESPEAQEEIYLVAGQWTEYHRAAGEIKAMVFLRGPDEALAEKYLQATALYLEMYQQLLGPYPYKKFALVENFWETGYGMPSFTLLGPRIIRMPFVLHSSYPHEILHNWWGNGVYVDYERGNWAEGLTTYLADHLIAEQREKGAFARRATLQKYTDYVLGGTDFPLTAFRQRESAATEAVGYGKTLMLFHMLRVALGDETFLNALQHFYKNHLFQRASFSDFKQAFSEVTGREVAEIFDQWVVRTGAPVLRVKKTKVVKTGAEYRLIVTLAQTQPGEPYHLEIPIAVTLKGEKQAVQTTVSMSKREVTFSLIFPKRPLRLDVDPEFDLFRRLARDEIPPALSFAFGAEKVFVILPSNESGEMRGAYDELARSWEGTGQRTVEVKWDMDMKRLPKGHAVWVFGWKNQFQRGVRRTLSEYGVVIQSKEARVAGRKIPRAGHSVVMTGEHPANPGFALTWLTLASPEAMPGLARKLPHYGRYGYLGFKGNTPDNVVKGVWPLLHSPLSVPLGKDPASTAALDFRAPLTAPRPSETTTPRSAVPSTTLEKKVDIGTVPDPAHEEEGILIAGTSPGSPAEKAGLKAGDVLYWIGKTFIRDLSAFAEAVKNLKPGIKVKFVFLRNDAEKTAWVVPERP